MVFPVTDLKFEHNPELSMHNLSRCRGTWAPHYGLAARALNTQLTANRLIDSAN